MQIGGNNIALGVAALYDLETGKQAFLERTPYPLGSGGPTVPRFIHGDHWSRSSDWCRVFSG